MCRYARRRSYAFEQTGQVSRAIRYSLLSRCRTPSKSALPSYLDSTCCPQCGHTTTTVAMGNVTGLSVIYVYPVCETVAHSPSVYRNRGFSGLEIFASRPSNSRISDLIPRRFVEVDDAVVRLDGVDCRDIFVVQFEFEGREVVADVVG